MEKQTRKNLVERLAEAGKIILNTELIETYCGESGFGVNYWGRNGILESKQKARYALIGGIEKTAETEAKLEELFSGTPLYQTLQKQEKFSEKIKMPWCREKLAEFADYVRDGKTAKAYKLIRKTLASSDVTEESAISPFYGFESQNFIGRNSEEYSASGNTEAEKYTDLAIIAGRLAKQLGKNSSKHYQSASIAAKHAGCTLGGIVVHFGRDAITEGLIEASKALKTREEIIAKESAN